MILQKKYQVKFLQEKNLIYQKKVLFFAALTNIIIDYGGGDKDFIPTLKSGKTIILSPPDGNSLQFVRVTADGGIDVYKAYREPVAMPGMMGS